MTRADVDGGFIRVRRLKGSKATVQPLMEHSEALLNERAAVTGFIRNLNDEQRLFRFNRKQFWRLFRKYAADAGIPEHKRHPHVLKHSIALAMIGTGIQNTRQWLGHKSIASTGEYLQISDEQAASAARTILV